MTPESTRETFARMTVGVLSLLNLALLSAACGAGTTAPPTAETAPSAVPAGAASAEPSLVFLAGDRRIESGQCTNLEWQSENVLRVYLDGKGVESSGALEVCPERTITFTLSAALADGSEISRDLVVEVSLPPTSPTAEPTEAPTEAPPPSEIPPTATVESTPSPTAEPTEAVSVEFYPKGNVYELPSDQLCTAVLWRTSGVKDVQLEREGLGRKPVGASGNEEVCFEGRTTFYLYYRLPDGSERREQMELRHSN